MLDKARFAHMITGFAETYGKTISDAAMDIYYLALKNLTPEQLQRAIEGIITGHRYKTMPTPAEILDAASGGIEQIALLALQKLEKAMRDYGAYESVMFDDPVIHAVVERVDWNGERGWQGLCHMPLDELKWWKKDFIKQYDAFKDTGAANVLVGIHDAGNMERIKDYKMQIRYIGDKEKAKALLEYKEAELPAIEMKGMEG